MAFQFLKARVSSKEVFNCLQRTVQMQNALLSQTQHFRFTTEKLVSSHQRCFATFCQSQCKIRLGLGKTGYGAPVITVRNGGLNKLFVRFSSQGNKSQKGNLTAALYIGSFGIAMLGFAYLGIPLYRMFCQTFGVGGQSAISQKIKINTEKIRTMKKIEDRTFTVTCMADTGATMKWDFRPQQTQVKVCPGETALVFYTARNPTDKPIVGISTYTVTPNSAANYFNKIQCFCFEEQILNPHEQVDMPVFFYIDPAIDDDIYLEDQDSIILSYTFFEAAEGMTLPLPGFSESKPSVNPA